MDAVLGISFEALQGVDLRTTKEKQAERLAKNREQIYDNVKDVVREGFQRAPFSDDYNDKIQKIAYRYSDYLEEMAPREAKAKKLDDQVLLHWAPLFIVHLVEASAKDAPDGSGVQYMRASTLAHYRKGFAAYLYYSAHKKGPIYKEIQLRMLQAEANARRRYGLVLGTKPKAVWGEKEAFEMVDMILDEHVDVETTLQRCAIVSLLLISGARPGALFATDYYPENFIRWEDVSFEVDEYGFKVNPDVVPALDFPLLIRRQCFNRARSNSSTSRDGKQADKNRMRKAARRRPGNSRQTFAARRPQRSRLSIWPCDLPLRIVSRLTLPPIS